MKYKPLQSSESIQALPIYFITSKFKANGMLGSLVLVTLEPRGAHLCICIDVITQRK